MEKNIKHKAVLSQEVISYLKPKPSQVFIDATIGFGGHSEAILEKISPNGKLLGIDQDEEALDWLGANLRPKYSNLTLKKGNFSEVREIAGENGFQNANGILADIGVSSYHLDQPERGFSFQNDGPLDMRMDASSSLTAKEVVNSYREDDLVKIFSEYGEERLSKSIARKIADIRSIKPLEMTLELKAVIEKVYTAKGFKSGKIHPATKVFQAIRIEVNDELESLKRFLPEAVNLLAPKGRLAIITFHSLEDRIVKNFVNTQAKDCICPPEYPVCRCEHRKTLNIITRKPILSSEEEMNENPRARSAKLRVIEKI